VYLYNWSITVTVADTQTVLYTLMVQPLQLCYNTLRAEKKLFINININININSVVHVLSVTVPKQHCSSISPMLAFQRSIINVHESYVLCSDTTAFLSKYSRSTDNDLRCSFQANE